MILVFRFLHHSIVREVVLLPGAFCSPAQKVVQRMPVYSLLFVYSFRSIQPKDTHHKDPGDIGTDAFVGLEIEIRSSCNGNGNGAGGRTIYIEHGTRKRKPTWVCLVGSSRAN